MNKNNNMEFSMKKATWERFENADIGICYECVLSEQPEQVIHIQKENDCWQLLFNGGLITMGSFANMKKVAHTLYLRFLNKGGR